MSSRDKEQNTLRELTQAEIAAARLRVMARELNLQADALEASVAPLVRKKQRNVYINPLTGKLKTIRYVGLDD
jgi:uncharacterized membrane protein